MLKIFRGIHYNLKYSIGTQLRTVAPVNISK